MSRTAKIILILIFLLAGFFRLYQLPHTPPGLYPDEAMNGNNAIEALHTGTYRVYYPENNGREGLFINIQAIFLKLIGTNEPWVLRLPSALFGIFTVLGIFFLARELFKTYSEKYAVYVGLLSSFLLATSFWHIIFSRIGFRAILAPFFLVWALYFLLKSLRTENSSANWQIPYSIFAGILFGAGFHTYIAYRVTPALILILIAWIWWLYKENRKRILLVSCFFIFASVITVFPLGLHYLGTPDDFFGRTGQISVFSSPAPLHDLGINIIKTAGMFTIHGDENWRHNYAGRPELFFPVGTMFLVGFILGIKNFLKKETTFPFLILFSWLGLAALPVVISNEGLPHALRAILMIPPVIILASVGTVALYNTLKAYLPKIIFLSTFYILISLMIIEPFNTYFLRWAHNSNTQGAFAADYVAIGHEINLLPKKTQKYMVIEAGGVDIRGIPMPAQTVMFITNSFLPENQIEKNIHYILPADRITIPSNAEMFEIK
ncbi:MAG: glycosyltransferase family 39 protein [Patescibacteria group bacterium]|nr:glycosyltransferase family 39 protein [Patescibacteria group bacterium]